MSNNRHGLTDSNHATPMEKVSPGVIFTRLMSLVGKERQNLFIAIFFIFINSGLNLIAPYLMGQAIDKFVVTHQYDGLVHYSLILLGIFLTALVSGYTQAQLMGRVGQRMMFNLRNSIFSKLQELPIEYFNKHKAGDLISRVNNDTDKINQFFSQSLVQFMSSIFTMIGAGIFLISIDPKLGAAALAPALLVWIFTKAISPWVKKRNALSMTTTGELSAEVQESLENFKVIVAFNRRDYFRKKFEEVNTGNYQSALRAGIANNIFTPIYGLSANIGQLLVLAFGIYLIANGFFSIGLLISFLAYVAHFYNPLRQIANLWASFQVALAGWDRISQILAEKSNLPILKESTSTKDTSSLLRFHKVSFAYSPEKEILKEVSFELERGKTYAFVGPTGGGKTTTASLIARLYDPTSGQVFLNGTDIRTYQAEERTRRIGFILQEPFLFTGSLRENILYGNSELFHYTEEQLLTLMHEMGFTGLLERFEGGLSAEIKAGNDSISLGQKQIIAFIRAVIRKPDLLILDEATANIDTVTEQLLEDILNKLPQSTTRIIIAHRLNTIENADEIYFINTGTVTRAGSLENAVEMLLTDHRVS